MTFHTAQVCLNGHVITAFADICHDRNRKFCPACGEPTIRACPKPGCEGRIIGKESYEMCPIVEDMNEPPGFCHDCGAAYPWTDRKKAALAEAIDELDQLPESDREKLKQSIPDVIQDTPKTQTAAARFTRAISAAGQFGGKMLSDVMTNVATAAVLNLMGLKP